MKPVLAWIKENIVLVICCSIVVITPIAAFLVSAAMNRGIRRDLESRVRDSWSDLNRLGTTEYTIPAALPGGAPVEKRGTLNKASLRIYEQRIIDLKEGSEFLFDMVVQENGKDRQLIIDGLFPDPDPDVAFAKRFNLAQAYGDAHLALLDTVNAGTPPQSDELLDALGEVRSAYVASLGRAEENAALTEDEQDELQRRLRKARMDLYYEQAKRHSVYAGPSVFELEPWTLEQPPDMGECYDWQEEYWVRAQVLRAVAQANTGPRGELLPVPAAPVKRITSLTVASRGNVMVRQGSSQGPGGGMGTPIERNSQQRNAVEPMAADPSEALQLDFQKSLTGRITRNGLYDVREATLIVHVASDGIEDLLAAINGTDLMTVTNLQLSEIDAWQALRDGYLYGQSHVVEAVVSIETIFFRQWAAQYMPEQVKEVRGVPLPQADDEYDEG